MPLTSQFEIEPLILQTIRDLSLVGLNTVADETRVAGITGIESLLPACILFTGPGQYSEGVHGGVQRETQLWQISILVKHVNDGDAVTTASEAGGFMLPILQALVGKQLTADLLPIEIIERPQPVYDRGFAEFPVILQTSFDVVGG